MEAKSVKNETLASTNLKVPNKVVGMVAAAMIVGPAATGAGVYALTKDAPPVTVVMPAEVKAAVEKTDLTEKRVTSTQVEVGDHRTRIEQTEVKVAEIEKKVAELPVADPAESARQAGEIAGIKSKLAKIDDIQQKELGHVSTLASKVKKLQSKTGVFGRFLAPTPKPKPKVKK